MLKQFHNINTAVGIALTIQGDGIVAINACKIVTNHNQLNFEKKVTELKSVEDLSKHFNPKSIVSLNLTGKGVLNKQVEKIDQLTQQNFSQILPNANFEDFYCQNFISGDRSFISVIRKADADHWINQIKEAGLTPLMLSLGPFPVYTILPQLNFYGEEVTFDGHGIKRDQENNNWKSYLYNSEALSQFALKIESEKIDEKLVLAYASAFQLVMAQKIEPIQANAKNLEIVYHHQLSHQKIKAWGAVITAAFFILLLINFMVFSYLSADNAKLTYQVSRSAKSNSDIRGVEDQIKTKEQKLQILGWDGAINKAVLMDNLAANLPAEITWKEVAISPVDLTESRNQKTMVFKNRQIRVTGLSQKILPVNEWMARIKLNKWAKDVQLENYIFNSEANSGQFTIIVSY